MAKNTMGDIAQGTASGAATGGVVAGPWGALIGAAIGGVGAGVFGRSSRKKARKAEKAAHALDIARARMELDNVRRAMEFRVTEDPRERAMLKQQAFGRGIGKSTIYEQDRERLEAIQSRRMAALQQAQGVAAQGLALIGLMKRARNAAVRQELYQNIAATALPVTFGAYNAGWFGRSATPPPQMSTSGAANPGAYMD